MHHTHALLSCCWSMSTLLLVASCASSCDAGTGGSAIGITFQVTSEPVEQDDDLGLFVTADGVEVELDTALVALGPIYLYENKTALAALIDDASSLVFPSAHAHAGDNHFDGGRVLGEMLTPTVVDALEPSPQRLGRFTAIAGRAQSMAVHLADVVFGDEPRISHRQLFVHGTWKASDHNELVCFTAAVEVDANKRKIEGLPIAADLSDNAIAQLELHPDAWFEGIAFADDDTAPTDADGCRVYDAPHPFAAYLAAGLTGRDAYALTVAQPEEK